MVYIPDNIGISWMGKLSFWRNSKVVVMGQKEKKVS